MPGFFTSPSTETPWVAYSAMNMVTCGSFRNPPLMNFWRIRFCASSAFMPCTCSVPTSGNKNVAGVADAKFSAEFWRVEDAHFQKIAGADRARGATAEAGASEEKELAARSARAPARRRSSLLRIPARKITSQVLELVLICFMPVLWGVRPVSVAIAIAVSVRAIAVSIASGVVVVVRIFRSVVAVVLAVLHGVEGEIVYHDAGDVGSDFSQHVAGAHQRLSAGFLGAGDEDDYICDSARRPRRPSPPARAECRRRCSETLRASAGAARGIASEASISEGYGGMWPGGNDMQARNFFDGDGDIVRVLCARETGAQAVVHGQAKVFVNCRPAHV